MKFRIDKIPKSEDDLEEIQREVEEEEHEHHHHEHSIEDIVNELAISLQSLESNVNEIQNDNENCKKELSRIYKILSKLVIASFTKNEDERIQILRELVSLLE
ncbi:MAG: hypothetical protein RXQ22_00020 [Sulfolobus sp.]